MGCLHTKKERGVNATLKTQKKTPQKNTNLISSIDSCSLFQESFDHTFMASVGGNLKWGKSILKNMEYRMKKIMLDINNQVKISTTFHKIFTKYNYIGTISGISKVYKL